MFRLEISWILFLEAPSFSHFSYFKPCIIQKQEQHLQKLASTIPVSWRKRKNVHHHLADCPAVFFRFAYLHSWRWEPSLLCGTFKAVLQHQKLGSQTVFFAWAWFVARHFRLGLKCCAKFMKRFKVLGLKFGRAKILGPRFFATFQAKPLKMDMASQKWAIFLGFHLFLGNFLCSGHLAYT